MRTLLSLGLLGCATTALVPLGCGAKIRYPEASEGPRVPDATAERLRECVDEFGGDLPRGYYVFDVAVRVDEEGRVVDVVSKGVPHADLAGCMRIALRAMTVPEDLLRLRKLRLPASPAPANGQTPAEGGLVGHPGVLVVVAVALADLIIEVGPAVIIVCAASLEVSKADIVETVRKRDDPDDDDPCQEHLNACLNKPLADRPGSVIGETRCKMCFDKCRGEKEWPKSIPLTRGKGSCEYWLPGWPR
ncbi:hypothetical protein [Polyangium jinanense]|uniref:Uncharacterized protein n=1 Tax=Polyangium jinanense TaxID=2829994 RepID=A0A9X3X4K9_9BACT|nr:hypothetical protein [Polyangium jinanense]MDC3954904.1 hypothetical protein [Polyangium jinanense]MDC3981326.1 hypothetical protein [Polyangium jinanense]